MKSNESTVESQEIYIAQRNPLPVWLIIAVPIGCLVLMLASFFVYHPIFPDNGALVSLLELALPLIILFLLYAATGRMPLLAQSPKRTSTIVWGLVFLFIGPIGWWGALLDVSAGKAEFKGAADIAIFVSTMVFVGLFEEMGFRGLLFGELVHNGLARGKNYRSVMWKAVWVSSIIFGAAHVVNAVVAQPVWHVFVSQMLYATMMGVFLAAVYARGRSLWWVALIHGGFDFLSQLVDITAPAGKAAGPAEPSLIQSMTITAFFIPWLIIGLVMVGRDIKRREAATAVGAPVSAG